MQTGLAFKEVGYALVAVVLPLVLTLLIVLIQSSRMRKRRGAREEARKSNTTLGAVAVAGWSVVSDVAGLLVQIILFLALLDVVFFATVPFGRSQGWW